MDYNTVIKTVSFSRLMDFEKCNYLAKLKYIDKVPEPQRELPPDKTEFPNDRGTRIHDAAELYVKGAGKVELIPELRICRDRFDELRTLYAQGKVQLEGEWAFTQNWAPVAWMSDNAWVRMKLDAMVRVDRSHARVIDYKTGKRNGNEVKHTEQGQIYQLGAFMREGDLTDIDVEFWYTDLNEYDVKHFTRAQGMAYFDKYHKRLQAMSACTDFKPNPNVYSCKWCPYRGNVCEYGISSETPIATSTRYRLPESVYTND
jgi:RecB family exonuclease